VIRPEVAERVLDAFEVKSQARREKNSGVSFSFAVKREALVHIRSAARARGLSLSAYCRRAIFAFAAFDMGLNPADLLAMEGRTAAATQRSLDAVDRQGQGHGRWRIVRLEDV
jgi:hypothetical protein